ncbi:uncharacterized protein J3R85_007713 [Psidium guajava]|nr:uncharacterized protein J3R85_007713 [Psidium guajava]
MVALRAREERPVPGMQCPANSSSFQRPLIGRLMRHFHQQVSCWPCQLGFPFTNGLVIGKFARYLGRTSL